MGKVNPFIETEETGRVQSRDIEQCLCQILDEEVSRRTPVRTYRDTFIRAQPAPYRTLTRVNPDPSRTGGTDPGVLRPATD